MKVPKVKFRLADTNFETFMLYYFCFGYNSKYVFRRHPKLKAALKYAKGKKKRTNIIRKYVKKIWNDKIDELENHRKIFQKEWNKINNKYMSALSEILEIEWPSNRRSITALISINSICPRILKTWTFSVWGFESDKRQMYEVVAHEVLHFLYFKKWKEVFPHSKERTFDTPYLEWHLSEILAPVILNNPKIQRIIKKKPLEYPEHRKIMIGRNSVTKHFQLIYNKSLKYHEPFSKFLKTSYNEIKKYENKFGD